MAKIKVRIEVTVEVDVDAWSSVYGIDPAKVREDVREYAWNQLDGAAAADENLWEVKR